MILFSILCVISVLSGCAILTLIGFELDRRSTLFLSPAISLCSLAILMGGLVAGGFTIGEVTPAVYSLWIGAAILGAIWHGKIVLANWRALVALAGLAIIMLLPCISEGIENYAGGRCLDAWAYVTTGQSLQQHPLGAEGWFSPDVQYASHFGKAVRCITFSFLALLAPLSGHHNDAQEILGHYVGWLFFVYGSACLFFARVMRLNRTLTWVFIALTIASGWTLKLISANSVDNTLALCFLPAIVGLMQLSAPTTRNSILLGAIVAANLYAYPESSPFTFCVIAALMLQKLIQSPQQFTAIARMGITLFTSAALFVAPGAPFILAFFRIQVNLAVRQGGDRPGEGFYPLLAVPRYAFPSYWGLVPDFSNGTYAGTYDRYVLVIAVVLTMLALAGMVVLIQRGNWSLPLFALSMSLAYTIFLVRIHYPYAAYKILELSWFALAYSVVIGAEWVWQWPARRSSKWMTYAVSGLGVGLCLAVGGFVALQGKFFYESLPFKSLREIKKVSALESLASGKPVAMIVNELYANIWGTHFLRDTKLYLAGLYRGYMAAGSMERPEPVDPVQIRFVVTDDAHSFDKKKLLSSTGPYYIWDLGQTPWILLTGLNNPPGLQSNEGSDRLLWIAKAYTELQVVSRTAIPVVIGANFHFVANPVEKARQQRVRVATGAGGFASEITIGNGMQTFEVPLQPGLNRILIRSVEKLPFLIRGTHFSISPAVVTSSMQNNDDPRTIPAYDQ